MYCHRGTECIRNALFIIIIIMVPVKIQFHETWLQQHPDYHSRQSSKVSRKDQVIAVQLETGHASNLLTFIRLCNGHL